MRRRLGGLVGLALVAIVAVGCVAPSADRAEAAATAWVERSAPPGARMVEITILGVTPESRAGVSGWVVEVTGRPQEPGQPAGIPYYFLLWVNGVTGEITMDGQG